MFMNKAIVIAAAAVLSTGLAFAQERSIEQSKERLSDSSAVFLNLKGENVSGVQFVLHYPKGARIAGLQDCLVGVPESHMGSFTTCKDFPDKNRMLVVISDIGRSGLLPSGMLGAARFESGSLKSGDFQLTDVVALDTDGQEIKGGTDRLIELQVR